jgi:hypothetical protein
MRRNHLVLVLTCGLAPAIAQTDWTLLTPTNSPPALTAHAMAFHLPTDRTVLFGGVTGGVRYDQTWLFDGTDWTQAAPTTVPPARVAHAMAYDATRGRLVMFGGIPAAGGLLGDTWEWDGTDWIAMTPVNSPSARRSFPMTFHPGRGTVVLWGGYTTTDLNDMWEWNGIDWAPITTANSPSPRRASDMEFDPVTGKLVLFSGYLQINDTWTFDGATWTLETPAQSPSARYDHSMVTDPVRGRIVTFGGPGAADTWEWDGSNWLSRTTATLPSARSDTYLSYDSVREQVLMFGSSATPETWRYTSTVTASVSYFGAGCAGTLGQAPALATTQRPWLDDTFRMDIAPLPANTIALMAYGLSNTTSGLGALPAPLAAIGMPGCSLQVDPVILDAFLASGSTATWNRPIPNDPLLLGQTLYCQGAALDPGANAASLIVANHAALRLGGR